MLAITEFTKEHADDVVGLILPIQQSEFDIPVTLESQPDLQDVKSFYQHGAGNFWVAVDGSNVVGSVALLDIGKQQVALRKMFVADRYRGAVHGVASSLLEVAMTWCRQKNVRQVYLGTTAKFLAAHRFYEKNEFNEVDKSELPGSFPIMSVDTKFYCRRL